ncbi:AAA family ATPase [Photobacterium damselae]|uniref:AAA family ATPase n=1 Tax=Photobacterium damselae TaxID=38293 RepID=UPI002934F563|nr:AAA family ATPase [Photobacterium damselae]
MLAGKPGVGKTETANKIANYLECQKLTYTLTEANKTKWIEDAAGFIRTCRSIENLEDDSYCKRKLLIINECDLIRNRGENIRELLDDARKIGALVIMTTNHLDRMADSIKSRCYCIEYPEDAKDLRAEEINSLFS